MCQDNNVIEIIGSDNKVSSAFVKANQYILQKYCSQFENLDLESKINKLKHLWFAEFKARLLDQDSVFCQIKFDSKTDLFLFIIKWGSN
jgi:hypothetical protein